MSHLSDACDELAEARKRLSMVEGALMLYLRETAIDKHPLEGIIFETADIAELLKDAHDGVKQENTGAQALNDKIDELSEKLNRVADEKEAVETLLSRVFTLVGGQFRPEMSWEEACEKAADLIVEHWEDDEVPSPPTIKYVAYLEEVYQRARAVADKDLPVGQVEELQNLKEAVATFDEEFSCEHADLSAFTDGQAPSANSDSEYLASQFREALRLIRSADDMIVIDALAEAALEEDWDELGAIAEDPYGEDRDPGGGAL